MVSSIASEEDIYFLFFAVIVVAAFTCDINLLLNRTKNHVKFDSESTILNRTSVKFCMVPAKPDINLHIFNIFLKYY